MIISIYFTWFTIFVFLPSLLLFLKFRKVYQPYPKTLFLLVVFCFLIGLPWDILAVKTGVWSFGQEQTLGVLIAGLPLEEILFLVFVPLLAGLTGLAILKVVIKR